MFALEATSPPVILIVESRCCGKMVRVYVLLTQIAVSPLANRQSVEQQVSTQQFMAIGVGDLFGQPTVNPPVGKIKFTPTPHAQALLSKCCVLISSVIGYRMK